MSEIHCQPATKMNQKGADYISKNDLLAEMAISHLKLNLFNFRKTFIDITMDGLMEKKIQNSHSLKIFVNSLIRGVAVCLYRETLTVSH